MTSAQLTTLTFLLAVSVCWARTATIIAHHAVLHERDPAIPDIPDSASDEDVPLLSTEPATVKTHHEIETTTTIPTTSSSAAPVFDTEPRAAVPTVHSDSEPRAAVPTIYSDKNHQWACPRREDIHPCTCVEVPGKAANEIETVALCRNIRNQKVLSDSMKGFQHYRIDYFVLDSCKLPPFPNGLMHNVDVKWIEVLNSTVQFHNDFLTCSKGCL